VIVSVQETAKSKHRSRPGSASTDTEQQVRRTRRHAATPDNPRSATDHAVHTEEVTGSIPVSPTR
jgi:hypothetical protein